MIKKILLTLLISAFLLTACGGESTPDPALDPIIAMTSAFATVNAAFTQTAMAVPTISIPTDTPVPTAAVLSNPPTPSHTLLVTVTVPIANCRYGPDKIYTGPYGLRSGKVREAFGRDETSNWLFVRELDGQKACWVHISTVTVQGDVATLDITPTKLQISDSYPPPTNISATRNGNQVLVSWDNVPLDGKDVFIESHYLLETWLCDGQKIVHQQTATNEQSLTFTDEQGCAEKSSAKISTASKRGYSIPAEISWPGY